jgi:tetratricopeptide (TPR) repeat protein
MAEGYLMMYEAFVQKPILLDSAWHYLLLTDEKKTRRYQYALIQYYFWKNEFDRIISASEGLSPVDCNAWTAYRIGEAYYQKQQYENALDFVNRATELKSEEPDFMNKKGKVLVMLDRLQQAKNLFEQIIYLQSKYESAYSNLSYVYLLLKNAEYALQLANKALALNPDAEDAQLNKVAALVALNRKQDAISLLNTILLNNPSNQKARLALQQLLKS